MTLEPVFKIFFYILAHCMEISLGVQSVFRDPGVFVDFDDLCDFNDHFFPFL